MNRLTALPAIGSAVFLAACAAPPDEISSLPAELPASPPAVAAVAEPPAAPIASAELAAAAQPVDGEVPVVQVAELREDTGLVCEPKRRSGSRVTRTVCVTREELAATQAAQAEAAQEYARDLDRERAMKDQQSRNGGPTTNSVIVFQ